MDVSSETSDVPNPQFGIYNVGHVDYELPCAIPVIESRRVRCPDAKGPLVIMVSNLTTSP